MIYINMNAYSQQNVNELKKKLVANIAELIDSKNLLGFNYRNHWQSDDDFVIVLDYRDPSSGRRISVEFSFDITALFKCEPGDCSALDAAADLRNLSFQPETMALLRILYIIFVGCHAVMRDLNNWKSDPKISVMWFQTDRTGQIEAYPR